MIDKLFHGGKQTKTIYSVKKRCQTIIFQCGMQTKTVRGYLLSTRSIADTVFLGGKQIVTVTHSKNDIRQVFHVERGKRQFYSLYCRKMMEAVFFGCGINRQGGKQVFHG
jgi:hypothetical protein